jgi:uncharacterized Zn-binding protein involved in type VI secretion
MPAIVRANADAHSGHSGYRVPYHKTYYTGGSSNVFINGEPVILKGNTCLCGDPAVGASGSVFVNGVAVHRQGDATGGHGNWIPCKAATGSPNVFANGPGEFGVGGLFGDSAGNVVVGPGGGGTVATDPDWDYAGHTFFENTHHDYQYFAAEYAGMDYLPKTGNAALPLETLRDLLREYATNVLGFAPDEPIVTGPTGEVSFTDPNYHPPRSLQEYINTVATEKGYLDSQGKSTLPLDYEQLIAQAQLASLYPYIQAQLARVNNGEQTLANTYIPPIDVIAAAAQAAVANIGNNPYANDPNLIGSTWPGTPSQNNLDLKFNRGGGTTGSATGGPDWATGPNAKATGFIGTLDPSKFFVDGNGNVQPINNSGANYTYREIPPPGRGYLLINLDSFTPVATNVQPIAAGNGIGKTWDIPGAGRFDTAQFYTVEQFNPALATFGTLSREDRFALISEYTSTRNITFMTSPGLSDDPACFDGTEFKTFLESKGLG